MSTNLLSYIGIINTSSLIIHVAFNSWNCCFSFFLVCFCTFIYNENPLSYFCNLSFTICRFKIRRWSRSFSRNFPRALPHHINIDGCVQQVKCSSFTYRVNITSYFFFRQNSQGVANVIEQDTCGYIGNNKKVVFIVHGFMSSPIASHFYDLASELIKVNIFKKIIKVKSSVT